MPIRFRCAYCNQLLGIARRKAGQVVRCPTCAGQVVVPTPEEADNAAGEVESESPPAGDGSPVFDRSDFDQIFNPPGEPQPAATGRGTAATGAPADFPRFDVEEVPPPAPAAPPPPPLPEPILPPGIFLSPKKAT